MMYGAARADARWAGAGARCARADARRAGANARWLAGGNVGAPP